MTTNLWLLPELLYRWCHGASHSISWSITQYDVI